MKQTRIVVVELWFRPVTVILWSRLGRSEFGRSTVVRENDFRAEGECLPGEANTSSDFRPVIAVGVYLLIITI